MKFRAVRIDETWLYPDEFINKHGINGKIYGCYLYSPDEITYCCSSVKSYWLEYLYTYIDGMDYGDELDVELMDANIDNDGGYYNKSVIDIIDERDKSEVEDFETDGNTRDDNWDDAREYFNGNHVI